MNKLKSKSVFIDQVKKDLTKTFEGQINTLKTQLETKNKEFSAEQAKFKELVEQSQKDKLETIQAKEKAFESQLKSLQEQIKSKEESLKTIQGNYEITSKQLITAAVAESTIKYEAIGKEKNRLEQQVRFLESKNSSIIVYVIIAVIIGIIIGLLF